jgi:hypothetical protein
MARFRYAHIVSAALRRSGFNPLGAESSRNREGLRVANSYSKVRVVADLDSDREAADLAVAARQALIAAGFPVETTDNPAAFYVAKKS